MTPERHHSVIPYLIVTGAAAAIQFYETAFGARQRVRMTGGDGRIRHAGICIGYSNVMLVDEFPEQGYLSPLTRGGPTSTLFLSVEDVDASFQRAVAAGAAVKMPVRDMFWGDRYAAVTDPLGHVWGLATRKEDLTPEETERRSREFMAGTSKCA